MTIATELAGWIAGLELSAVPEPVRARMRASILDGFGCAIFGASLDWSALVRDTLAATYGGSSGVNVWGTRITLPAPQAALANGVAVHAFELDDFNGRAPGVHATASVLPAALAVTEMRGGVDGPRLLTACVIGHELVVRLASAMGARFPLRGWQSPALFGAVAAAGASAHAMRLDAPRTTNALSLAALQACGLQAAKRRGLGKRLYAGRAAEIGVSSALLAEAGADAPGDVFEGPTGFLAMFGGDDVDASALTRDLGQDLAATSIAFKLYAACGSVHPALDALRDLRRVHPEITADSVAEVRVGLSATSLPMVGAPYAGGDVTTAQFSLAYAVAVELLEGQVLVEQFRPALLRDGRVLALAARVRSEHDAAIDARGMRGRNAARVEIALSNGTVLSAYQETARGSEERPATQAQLDEKYASLADATLGAQRARALAEAVGSLGSLADAAMLGALASL